MLQITVVVKVLLELLLWVVVVVVVMLLRRVNHRSRAIQCPVSFTFFNRAFYSYLLSEFAFEWKRGWR